MGTIAGGGGGGERAPAGGALVGGAPGGGGAPRPGAESLRAFWGAPHGVRAATKGAGGRTDRLYRARGGGIPAAGERDSGSGPGLCGDPLWKDRSASAGIAPGGAARRAAGSDEAGAAMSFEVEANGFSM